MVIVDTTVLVDYFQGVRNAETDWLDAALERQRLGLTDIILCEVLQGVRDDVAAKGVERELRQVGRLRNRRRCARPRRGA